MDLELNTSRWTRPAAPDTNRSYLHPGQMVCSAVPVQVTTILGSCVAVCLWDPFTKVGGMVHYLLPETTDAVSSSRYGTTAIPLLVEAMQAKGARLGAMQAKVFGGGCVLKALTNNLGDKNVAVAKSLLSQFGIRVVQEDTLGNDSRKVLFNTANGSATVQSVRSGDGR